MHITAEVYTFGTLGVWICITYRHTYTNQYFSYITAMLRYFHHHLTFLLTELLYLLQHIRNILNNYYGIRSHVYKIPIAPGRAPV